MKKILLFSCIALFSFVGYSCDDTLDDELFVKYAYIVKKGWQETAVELTETSVMKIPVTIGVNGTSLNDKDVVVKLGFDPDTLAGYNKEKYKEQTDLFYKMIAEDAVEFPEEVVIENGKESAVFHITLDKSKVVDQYEDYVLPISIIEASEYEKGPSKYTKSLMHLSYRNDFSGNYSGSDGRVFDVANDGSKRTVNNKTLYGFSLNECFFFVGDYDRENPQRGGYIARVHWEPATGEITLTSDIPSLQLAAVGTPRIQQTVGKHATDDAKKIVATTIRLEYTYLDTSVEGNAKTMKFTGSLTMTDQNVPIDRPERVSTPD